MDGGQMVEVNEGYRWYDNVDPSFEDHEMLLGSYGAENVYQKFLSAARTSNEQADDFRRYICDRFIRG